jgi:hypothetical protein
VLAIAVKVELVYFHSIQVEHRAYRRKYLAYVLLRDSIAFPLMCVLLYTYANSSLSIQFFPRSGLMYVVNLIAVLNLSVRSPGPISRICSFVDNIPLHVNRNLVYCQSAHDAPFVHVTIVLGCRLILNLRETYYQPLSEKVTLDACYEILRPSCGQFIPFVQNAGHT